VDTPLSSRIASNPKYSKYFDGCLGALDGTYIEVYVAGLSCVPFRNRKETLSQNVLVIYSFELQFSYVLAGWKESVYNRRVLKNAIYEKGFKIPKNRYYLADAGYSNSEYLLIPYRNTRYYLKETLAAGLR
jgi:hypothetical protein